MAFLSEIVENRKARLALIVERNTKLRKPVVGHEMKRTAAPALGVVLRFPSRKHPLFYFVCLVRIPIEALRFQDGMERVDEYCALCDVDARIAQALAKAGQQVRFSQSA
ncbi:hypothetical protein D3C87_1553470 [compost metagenome]